MLFFVKDREMYLSNIFTLFNFISRFLQNLKDKVTKSIPKRLTRKTDKTAVNIFIPSGMNPDPTWVVWRVLVKSRKGSPFNPNGGGWLIVPTLLSNGNISMKKGIWRSQISWHFIIHCKLSQCFWVIQRGQAQSTMAQATKYPNNVRVLKVLPHYPWSQNTLILGEPLKTLAPLKVQFWLTLRGRRGPGMICQLFTK